MPASSCAVITTACLLGAGVVVAGVAAEPVPRPNLVVIVADDLGWSDVGCYGGEIATPHLDRLAADGIRFTSLYSTGRCWPSRSCLLTGRYPQQINQDPPQGRVPAWTRFLPHHLKPVGYRCYASGKWHVPGAPRAVADGGFDHAYVIEDHDRHFNPRRHDLDDRPLPPVKPDSGWFSSTGITDHALSFLDEHGRQYREAPFLLYLAYITPHFPLHAPAEDIARCRGRYDVGWDAIRRQRHERQKAQGLATGDLPPLEDALAPSWNLKPDALAQRIGPGEVGRAVPWDALTPEQRRFQAQKMEVHAAMIEHMDRQIGRVLERLAAMGAADDTLVLFVSDNGASAEQIIRGDGHDPASTPGSAASYLGLGPGWSSAANTPFRRHKSWAHEGGIASPGIVRWPKGIAARGVLRRDVGHFVDVAPTLLAVAGVTPVDSGAPPFAGRSLVPAFAADGALPPATVFFHHHAAGRSPAGENSALRVGDWKLVRAGGEASWELYDLSGDRGEQRDCAGQQPERVRTMAAEWERRLAEYERQAGPVVKPAKGAGRAGHE